MRKIQRARTAKGWKHNDPHIKIENATILTLILIAAILKECVNDLDKRLRKIERSCDLTRR